MDKQQVDMYSPQTVDYRVFPICGHGVVERTQLSADRTR